ncbi:hypothetical protein F0562_020163 [Nyssa sinensis]|uniref:Uncharacterized protein n=1 Tax=Nyssa sinensis TaxID=561372 RepID=A0A5J5BR30_9ASTE|nr:hypothetical protein F0562_020163 [Nyssa sinensis]
MFNVRRVVVTCSISALVPNPSWPSNTLFRESSWTDLDYCNSRQDQQWDSDLVKGRHIKDVEDNLSIIVVAVASLLKDRAAWLQPKQDNTIRGLLLQSGGVVEKLAEDSCRLWCSVRSYRMAAQMLREYSQYEIGYDHFKP